MQRQPRVLQPRSQGASWRKRITTNGQNLRGTNFLSPDHLRAFARNLGAGWPWPQPSETHPGVPRSPEGFERNLSCQAWGEPHPTPQARLHARPGLALRPHASPHSAGPRKESAEPRLSWSSQTLAGGGGEVGYTKPEIIQCSIIYNHKRLEPTPCPSPGDQVKIRGHNHVRLKCQQRGGRRVNTEG